MDQLGLTQRQAFLLPASTFAEAVAVTPAATTGFTTEASKHCSAFIPKGELRTSAVAEVASKAEGEPWR